MSYATDKSDQSTLPDPELNPLLNPLLAANLGRWAEVYFTNPPEKRVQAVTSLLRDLEGEASSKTALPASDDARSPVRARFEHSRIPLMISAVPAAEAAIVCSACSHPNLHGQKFCGMCGSSLATFPQDSILQAGPSELEEERILENSELAPSVESIGCDAESIRYEEKEANRRSIPAAQQHEDWDVAPPLTENDLPSFAREPEPVPYRFRLYIGVIVAIVLVALIYMARRGEVFSDGHTSPAARPIPAAPVIPTSEATDASAPLPVAKTEKSEIPPAQPVQTPKQPEPTSEPERTVRQSASRTKLSPPIASTASAEPSGTEEFAEAQKYLNGNPRDSREAAHLLWKAVADGNAGATVALADLYLRGDGVSKNCDQGRLLLDVAAKKGAKGAAERLRNLQAFGCR